MPDKLLKSRYYLVHLGTCEVNSEIHFARCFEALDWADRHGFRNVAALPGREIAKYPNVWKVQ